jgi:glycosyltransferase involved in cell wall biosynthesis
MHKMQVAGAEVLVRQIIERLEGLIDPVVLCLDDVGEIGYQLRERGVPVIVLGRQPGLDIAVARRLADEVKKHRIEVLHAHQYTPFFYSALARLRYRAKTKILFTEHGRHFPDVISWKRHWMNRLLLNRYADLSTACCDFSTRALREIEGFPDAFTLHNGVDITELPPRGDEAEVHALREKLGLDFDRPYAACVARFHPVKDHATLIRGWARVHEQLPEAQLLLVGDGEERENIEALIEELSTRNSQLATRISFLGIRHDVGDILRAVDVFTLTSISEAASLTLLEAMASECPSVVTDVGGNAEHLREGIDGYLVPRADDERLAERLFELLSDPGRAEQFGRNARTRVIENFNLTDAVQQYYEHFKTLSGKDAGPYSASKVSSSELQVAR